MLLSYILGDKLLNKKVCKNEIVATSVIGETTPGTAEYCLHGSDKKHASE